MTQAVATLDLARPGPPLARSAVRAQVRLAQVLGEQQLISELIGLLKHPVYSLVVAFALIEYLQSQKVIPSLAGTVLEGALVTQGVLGELARSGAIEEIVKAGVAGGETIAKIAPLLALAAG